MITWVIIFQRIPNFLQTQPIIHKSCSELELAGQTDRQNPASWLGEVIHVTQPRETGNLVKVQWVKLQQYYPSSARWAGFPEIGVNSGCSPPHTNSSLASIARATWKFNLSLTANITKVVYKDYFMIKGRTFFFKWSK